MKAEDILKLNLLKLRKLGKKELITLLIKIKKIFFSELNKKDEKIKILTKKIEELQQAKQKDENKKINKEVNQPTSKKPEWDKDGYPKKKKKKNQKGRKKRKGCGNQNKENITPDEINHNALEKCPNCGKDLSQQKTLEPNSRIIEDIPSPPGKTVISKEVQERKWCPNCKKIVTAKTEKALPGSDIGLNTLILSIYFWVITAMSLPNIQRFLNSFMKLKISSAGISKLLIRVSKILQPIYNEILEDVKSGFIIWADETGWRIKGDLAWLWIFANKRSAYYWMDRTRGSPVVRKILGQFFLGVLIVDAWGAYNQIVCDKQTCMSHIFRKIRKFIETFPQYKTVLSFYLKLKRIIKRGEKLQKSRKKYTETEFNNKLKQLKNQLNLLLQWKNPNPILKKIIKKVKRQEDKILTFVEHDDAPYHNNYGEYIIRKGVLKRKISGGSMSEEGAKAYACLQSIAQTCHLRNISFFSFLRKTLVHYIRTGRPLLLTEYEDACNPKIKIAA